MLFTEIIYLLKSNLKFITSSPEFNSSDLIGKFTPIIYIILTLLLFKYLTVLFLSDQNC